MNSLIRVCLYLFVGLMMLYGSPVSGGWPLPVDKEAQKRRKTFEKYQPEQVSLSFRVMVADSTSYLHCSVRNDSDRKAAVEKLYHGDNDLRIKTPNSRREKPVGFSCTRGEFFFLDPGKTHTWNLDTAELVQFARISGMVTRLRWHCQIAFSPGIWIAAPENGQVTLPPPQEKTVPGIWITASENGRVALPAPMVKPLLVFFYHEESPPDIGFLILNGKDEKFKAPAPLSQKSSISVSVPGIDYSGELNPSKSGSKTTIVESGKVAKWQIPWQTVLDLIPQKEVEAIKKAGGDVDLVWKVGEYESPVLPLRLLTESETENLK